jgi:hypothetical protein
LPCGVSRIVMREVVKTTTVEAMAFVDLFLSFVRRQVALYSGKVHPCRSKIATTTTS